MRERRLTLWMKRESERKEALKTITHAPVTRQVGLFVDEGFEPERGLSVEMRVESRRGEEAC